MKNKTEQIMDKLNQIKNRESDLLLPREVDLGTIKFSKGIKLEIFLKDAERRAKITHSILLKYPHIIDEILRGEHD